MADLYDNVYKAQLQSLRAKRQAAVNGLNEEADVMKPKFQQDKNQLMIQNEQNRRRIRDMMARFNTIGGGQQQQAEQDNDNQVSNKMAGVQTDENNFLKSLYNRINNTNSQYDASEQELMSNMQMARAQAAKSGQGDGKESEINSIYVALNQAIDKGEGDYFLSQNRDDIISRYGQKVFDDMWTRSTKDSMLNAKRTAAHNINTTPQNYSGYSIFS